MAMHPTEPIHVHASDMELPLMPFAPEQILGGDPVASGNILWQPEDDSIRRNGVWQHTPGKTDYHQGPNEVSAFVFFSGVATVTPEGHAPFEVGAGSVIFLPEGTSTVWDVHETVRAFYWVHE